MSGGRAVSLAFAIFALGAAQAWSDQSPEPAPKKATPPESLADTAPDEDLLEFLGGLDAEGEEWTEYLTETDIAQVAEAGPASEASEVKEDE